jgi:hypothetical protein
VEAILSKKGKPTGSVIDRYRYPTQEMEIRRGHELKLKTEEKFGEVVRVNRAEHSIDIRKGRKMAEVHPPSVFEHKHINAEVIEDAIFAIVKASPAARRTGLPFACSARRRHQQPREHSRYVWRDGRRFRRPAGSDLAEASLQSKGLLELARRSRRTDDLRSGGAR